MFSSSCRKMSTGRVCAGRLSAAFGGIPTILSIANIESRETEQKKGTCRKFFDAPDPCRSGASSLRPGTPLPGERASSRHRDLSEGRWTASRRYCTFLIFPSFWSLANSALALFSCSIKAALACRCATAAAPARRPALTSDCQ